MEMQWVVGSRSADRARRGLRIGFAAVFGIGCLASGSPVEAQGYYYQASICPDAPLDGCRATVKPRKSKLEIATDGEPDTPRFQWKWAKGEATTAEDFGDPFETTGYAVCVFDEVSEDNFNVRVAMEVPAGGTCKGKPCWISRSDGRITYYDPEGTPDGVIRLDLQPGPDGKASFRVRASRDDLTVGEAGWFQNDRVIAQLLSTDEECWTATFSAPAGDNTMFQFEDKSD